MSVPNRICPGCQGQMASIEKSGITIDHCESCGGVFLDRGELGKLLAAEARDFDVASAGQRGFKSDAEEGGRTARTYLQDLFKRDA